MIKNYLLLVGLILISISCQKERADEPIQDIFITDNNKLLMLKVDYETLEFEGGIELNFNSLVISDSIPMEITINEPGDFGDISIVHQPTQEPIFFGTVVWSGLGERSFPEELLPPTEFLPTDLSINLPTIDQIKFISSSGIESGFIPSDYNNTWNSIAGLSAVEEYMVNGAKVALLLYTPSVGLGNPADWDWYYMLYL